MALAAAFWLLGRGGVPQLACYQVLGALAAPLVAMQLASRVQEERQLTTAALLAGLVLALAATSLATSMNRGVSAITLAGLAAGAALFLAAALVPRHLVPSLVVFQLVLAIPIAASAVLEPFGHGWIAGADAFPGRATANMGGPGPLGAVLAMVFPVAAALFVTERVRKLAAAWGAAALLAVTAITATFSRAALIAAAVSLAIAALHLRRGGAFASRCPSGSRSQGRLLTLVLLAALIVPAYNFAVSHSAPVDPLREGQPGRQAFQLVRRIEGTGMSTEAVRLECWRTALREISHRPLTGVGAGCFGTAAERFSPDSIRRLAARLQVTYEFAYNDCLQVGAELGLPALAALVALLAFVFRAGARGASPPGSGPGFARAEGRQGAALAGLVGALAGFVTQGLVDFPFHLPTHQAIFWVDIGLVLALAGGSTGSEGRSPRHRRTSVWAPTLTVLIAVVIAVVAGRALLAEQSARQAVASRREGDAPSAISRSLRAVHLAPYEHTYWVLLGESYNTAYASGMGPESTLRGTLKSYKRAAQTRPYHAPTYGRIGALYLSHAASIPGATDSARVYLTRSIALNPYYADSHTNLGTVLACLGAPDEARREFLTAARLDSTTADPVFNLANLEASAGRTDEAITWYRAALSRDADHFGSLMNLAALLLRESRPQEAFPYAARAAVTEPRSAEAQALLEQVQHAGAGSPAGPL
jgi:O-antigen ligase